MLQKILRQTEHFLLKDVNTYELVRFESQGKYEPDIRIKK